MKYHNKYHLTYCTNVHPAENWQETFHNLQTYVLPLKEKIAPRISFGIGLRLCDLAAKELLIKNNIESFKEWLEENNLYVFTMNGFPFGEFHRGQVKDQVHQPDWTTKERLQYTINLIEILAQLLPTDIESGSISTSSVSYRLWSKNISDYQRTVKTACHHLAVVAEYLYCLKREKNISIHIDIEPEPDGLIEDCTELLKFFRNYLIPETGKYLQEELKISLDDAKEVVLEHIQVCYDVCHSALLYEDPGKMIKSLQSEGIKIGKVQISSAIKIAMGNKRAEREFLYDRLAVFAGSIYLHQVIARKKDGSFERYPDLGPAMEKIFTTDAEEWRIHFHVPVFVENYNGISSTREQIKKVLEYLEKESFTDHLEIETYTWDILPPEMKINLLDSIEREYQWVLKTLSRK